ncbi:unnamed protein product [Prorocentrum cordatum]|nr:unnamed protein product [Polarella glacialis]|mmetsp:Transcript_92562/g.248235  ORF Transcript_92562/g.248235 Transcript_92562/m.248235 type:complete len:343 (-) Transcript_92562:65-1093(-)
MQAKVTVERILSRAAPAGGRVRFVAASSIGHAYNLNGLFAAFAADAEICLPAGACQLAQTLAEPPACGCEATVLFATPQGYGALLEHEVVRSGELRSRLREHALPFYAFSAGCPLPAGTAEGVEELLGARVMQNFGTSEVGVIAAEEVDPGDCGPPCKRPHLAQERGGDASADKGVPWGQLELRPPGGGRLLPHGAEGEVAIRVPWCSDGYLVNQRLLPHPDAPFVRTGDAGRVVLRSPGGRASLFLMQRLWAPLEVRRGGLRLLLQAYEVEEALLRANPEALGAAALQGPDGKLFCVVACPMEPRLDGWLQPDKLLRVDRLPTSPAGKILYSTLRELLLLD